MPSTTLTREDSKVTVTGIEGDEPQVVLYVAISYPPIHLNAKPLVDDTAHSPICKFSSTVELVM